MVNHISRLVVFIGFTFAGGLLWVKPANLGAQTVSGTILGLVQDQQGAVVGSANVLARNLETGAVREAKADDKGEYRITSVPAGSYKVSSTAPGFKTEVRSGVQVTVGGKSQ